ncbi:hypothetical protein Dfri01_39080 [Dyadobacter frigoris]|uniref:hypothetical protein n=1 Tax=Dyadobacter frigoris TaxID=2576211 RepID=UPI0024A14B49|nr:hypothetical protein [Dyadobacter frigoris]GLU54447.1 hypothetical protein Dfri01_39080 [Dyadobacter frigoris]
MTTKQKIALQTLMQKVQRGILNEEQAKEQFKIITGRDADEIPGLDDEEGQQLGEYLTVLSENLEAAEIQKEQAALEAEKSTVDLNQLTDKMAQKRPAGKSLTTKAK